jgi:hypothetical protein
MALGPLFLAKKMGGRTIIEVKIAHLGIFSCRCSICNRARQEENKKNHPGGVVFGLKQLII